MSTQSNLNEVSTVQPKQADQQLNVPHAAASRGLAGMFDLNIRAALLAIVVDVMVFGVDTFSVETLLPLGAFIAAVLAWIVYRIQRESGDTKQSAFTKCLIIGLLTAIPVPITPIVAVPGGLLGIVNAVRRR